MTTDHTISTLNSLIDTCRDAEKLLRAACDALDAPEFREFFGQLADERAAFAGELDLERTLVRFGGAREPAEGEGRHHRQHGASADVTSVLSTGGLDGILDAAEGGERVVESMYEVALQIASVPRATRSVIERQYALIRRSHAHLRRLRTHRTAA